jgi:hypothetical protein
MSTHLPIVSVSHRPGRQVPARPPADRRSTAHQDDALRRASDAGVELDEANNVLVLNYTMSCPLACDFCCYACGPHRTETMDVDLAHSLVDQAADLGVFGSVAITGGEPFLCYDDMLSLSHRLHDRRLPFAVITACAWASDGADVRGLLSPLVDAGLVRLVVSHDPSHERWVSRDQVRHVVDTAVTMGLETEIYGTFYDENASLRSAFPDLAASGSVALFDRTARPDVGRRRNAPLRPSQAPAPDWTAHDTCYRRVYHELTVFWDGEVYPCCSVYNRETPGISFGNVYHEPLSTIWDRIDGSRFLRIIKRRGFAELFALLRREAPDVWSSLPDRPLAMDACHLCHLLMGDVEVARRIRDALDDAKPREEGR